MKNKFILAVAVLVSATLITSCSIEKRHYMDGYHVEWKNKNNKNNTVAVQQEPTQTVVQNQTAPVSEEQNIAPVAVENNAQEAVVANEVKSNTVSVGTTESFSTAANEETVTNDAAAQNIVTKQAVKAAVKQAEKTSAPGDGPSKGLLILLCFLIPWLAVGLATNWEAKPLIINLLLSLTCIGAIIHAIVVVNRNVK
jgi:uncharacterized membrane protein YqaE (UPF0057 family)